jgi:cyclopropane-fatty-acyl-phospholipid synthase
MGLVPRLARNLVRRRLAQVTCGQLTLRDAGGTQVFGQPAGDFDRGGDRDGDGDGLAADLQVHDDRFWRAVAIGGGLGAADAYLAGWWDSADLTSLVRLLARNRAVANRLEAGVARLRQLADRLRHAARANTRRGSRRNIEAHYDLGDELFALFLDPSMTYSAGFFERPDATLEEAQIAKIDRLCRKLRLGPRDHLLEIGTGWGSLAIHAAGLYGCRVTTTTISPAQHAAAARRIAAAGLGDRIQLLQADYRDLAGSYSKIVSVEMVEAVGLRYLPAYFAALDRLLRRDGLVALQAITIAERNYAEASRGVDFIQRYIFPGGAIPSLTALCAAAARASALTPLQVEDLGLHYAATLAHWRARFTAAAPQVRRLGFDERFLRLFHYYFCYCEGAFRERAIGDVQVLFAGPEYRGATCLEAR